VHVHLTVDDEGQATANLVVDKQQTLDLLQRDSSSLNRALQDAGLNLAQSGLNFSLREQYRQNDNYNGGTKNRSLTAEAVASTEATQSHTISGSYAPHSVRLDIRV
jgi:flagellar hook-length control protein FliK